MVFVLTLKLLAFSGASEHNLWHPIVGLVY